MAGEGRYDGLLRAVPGLSVFGSDAGDSLLTLVFSGCAIDDAGRSSADSVPTAGRPGPDGGVPFPDRPAS